MPLESHSLLALAWTAGICLNKSAGSDYSFHFFIILAFQLLATGIMPAFTSIGPGPGVVVLEQLYWCGSSDSFRWFHLEEGLGLLQVGGLAGLSLTWLDVV